MNKVNKLVDNDLNIDYYLLKGGERVLINENYKVETDSDKNVILYKKIKKKVKEGEEQQYGWSVDGYYPTIKMALKDWTKKELFATELKDMETVNNKLDEIHNIINNLNL